MSWVQRLKLHHHTCSGHSSRAPTDAIFTSAASTSRFTQTCDGMTLFIRECSDRTMGKGSKPLHKLCSQTSSHGLQAENSYLFLRKQDQILCHKEGKEAYEYIKELTALPYCLLPDTHNPLGLRASLHFPLLLTLSALEQPLSDPHSPHSNHAKMLQGFRYAA